MGRSDSPYQKSKHHKAIARSGVLARQWVNGPKDGRDPQSSLIYIGEFNI